MMYNNLLEAGNYINVGKVASNGLLSDKRITDLKNRIDRSRKIRLAKPNGCIVERSRRSGRSTNTKLLGQ